MNYFAQMVKCDPVGNNFATKLGKIIHIFKVFGDKLCKKYNNTLV